MQKIVQKVRSLGVGGQLKANTPIKIFFPIQKAKKGELVSKKWINWNVLFEWFLQIHILHFRVSALFLCANSRFSRSFSTFFGCFSRSKLLFFAIFQGQ